MRSPHDYYPTPAQVTESLITSGISRLPAGNWLEPCAGDGAIIRAVNELIPSGINWRAVEIQERFASQLSAPFQIADFLSLSPESFKGLDVVITNPPYKLAARILQKCFDLPTSVHLNSTWQIRPVICMLLPLTFLATEERARLIKYRMPEFVLVFPNRPKFGRFEGTAKAEYAWFVWSSRMRESGKVIIL